ncbi:MAG: glycosyltransferase family 2 protein [Candidatus Promineifilaceae bacterium]|jgi:glycosyltransferase involved in cell wall biosynthesis
MSTAVIIPALNEEGAIAAVVRDSLVQDIDWVIVADNGSSDETAEIARQAGAQVVDVPCLGYGYACAAGTARAIALGATVLVYIDGDYSSVPDEMVRLLNPLRENKADLVLGSRVLGTIGEGAMPPHQKFGNDVSSWLISKLYGVKVTDLGPYRAIRTELIQELGMREMTFGWPTEMMVKAVRNGARIVEVPVSWRRRRAGQSKVSGNLRGSLLAAYYILGVTIRYAIFQ